MSAAPSLRPYQQHAIDAVLRARREGKRRLLVALPTGAGKTVVFARLAALAKRPVLVLAHREELLEQARDKLAAALGDGQQVALERAEQRAAAGSKVVVASIRSLHSERLARLRRSHDFGLVIYDECHHAAAEDNVRVLRELGVFDADYTGTLLGFTATTERGDGRGLDHVFEHIAYARTLPEMIDDGYLVPLRGYRIATQADLRGLSAAGQDFREDELAEAVDLEARNALVARSVQELARERRTVVFCVSVGHATNLARALNALGVRAGMVHGNMPRERRKAELEAFRRGELQALTNAYVLTEGFDDPGVSCVAMARPTRSAGLYAQCIGRGTRLHPDKSDCLILDFADVSDLDLCSLPSLFGVPRQVDLQGEDVSKARGIWQKLQFDHPGFELEADGISLEEIQQRAARFDPLGLRVDDEVRAVSQLAFFSLGQRGVGLHFLGARGQLHELLVLRRAARGKIWEVQLDGKSQARFSMIEQALEAVDFEINRRGVAVYESALPDASWRRDGRAEALRLATFARVCQSTSLVVHHGARAKRAG